MVLYLDLGFGLLSCLIILDGFSGIEPGLFLDFEYLLIKPALDSSLRLWIRFLTASFLDIHDSPEIQSTTLWETGSSLKRKIISYSTYKKRKNTEEEWKLEQKIKEIESIIVNIPTEEVHRVKKLQTPA